MTTIFVPIDEVTTTGSGMIASGQVTVVDIDAAPATGAITEMARQGTVGKILSCIAKGNILKLAAEIWDAAAMAKLWEKVYRGFLVNILPDGRLLQCSLVDHPNALVAKRGSGVIPLPIDIEGAKAIISTTPIGVQKMANTNKNLEDQRLNIGDGAHDANAAAIELIKSAKSGAPVQSKPGHRDFINWLAARSGR